jgi:uncharacterized protein YjbI with pentapeptide repeats
MGEDPEFKNGYALIVGVGKYAIKSLSVDAIANDAEEIEKVLKDPDFCAYPKDRVKRLVNDDATKNNIFAELDNLYQKTQKATKATVLIFLAGHGHLDEKNKQYYFLPHDTKANLPDNTKSNDLLEDIKSVDVSTAISSTKLMEEFRKLSNLPSVERLAIFCHTCYSGKFGTPLSADTPVTSSSEPIPTTVFDELTQGAGRCIVSSSRQNQQSWIEKGSENSIFGKQLIAGLKGEGSSANEKVVRILDLCYFLDNTVKREAKKLVGEDQVPVFSLYQSENFPVAKKSGGETNYCLRLHLFLVRHLNLDELKVLSMVYNVASDQMQGKDVSSLALELIRQSAKSGGLRALVRMLRQNRYESLEQLPDDKASPEMNKEYDQYLQMVDDNIRAGKIASFRKELEKWLLEKELRDAKRNDPIRDHATQKTREILSDLNSIGKSEVVRILYDYKLIGENKPISLQEVDLTGASLNSYDFSGFDLQGAVLNHANLSRTKLNNSNLKKAKLNEAELCGVELHNAILREVELKNANLNGADLSEADLSGADLTNARIQGPNTLLKRTNFYKAILDNADLTGADIYRIKLNEAKMNGTKLDKKWDLIRKLLNRNELLPGERGIDLAGADLSDANLDGMIFKGQNLKDVIFSGSSLLRADFSNAILDNTDFQNAKLITISFISSLFQSVANLFNSIFRSKEDRGFMYTVVWGSDQAIFTGASLNEVKLQGAKVSPEQLWKAKYIKNTMMPKDTEPWSSPPGITSGPRVSDSEL